MDTVIKGFLGVFIFAMIVYLSAGLISAEMDTHAARSYMDSAKKEIAESNMSPTVITAVQGRAAKWISDADHNIWRCFRDRWRRT